MVRFAEKGGMMRELAYQTNIGDINGVVALFGRGQKHRKLCFEDRATHFGDLRAN